MAYTWKDGELITAEKLNNTGGGSGLVVNVTTETQGDATIYTMDKTAREIITCFESGMMPILHALIKGENAEGDGYFIINNCQKASDGRAYFLVPDFPKTMGFQAITLDDYPSYTSNSSEILS